MRITATVYSGADAGKVIGDGLASVGYDAASNHISTAGWQYDAAGNQTRAQRADGSWQRYVYDAAGRLIKVQSDAGVTQLSQTYGASS
ncbi:MAG: RHS repeat domain-containing protein [Blastocatellia bacterium]